MKIKTVLIVSLTINAVPLGMFGYLQTLPVEPLKSSSIIYFVNQPGGGGLVAVLKSIAAEPTAP